MRIEDVDILELIEKDVALRRTAPSYRGGQWSGPCPFSGCGAARDGFQVWPDHNSGRGKFWCRKCGVSGDAIEYLRLMDGLSYVEACRALSIELSKWKERKPPPAPKITKPPSVAWQEIGMRYIAYAEKMMREHADNPARQYFTEGGLTEATIKAARLGWAHKWWFDSPERWGFPEDDSRIFLGQGAVIPLFAYNILWGIKIRYLPPREYPKGVFTKYGGPRGSITCLYGLDDMRPGYPALLVEGERDRLLAKQELGAVVDAVTTGGSAKGIPQEAIAPLLHCPALLVAYDGDLAGLLGANKVLAQVAYRANPLVVPHGYDLTSLHQDGHDLKTWFVNSLGKMAGAGPGETLDDAIAAVVERLNRLKED